MMTRREVHDALKEIPPHKLKEKDDNNRDGVFFFVGAIAGLIAVFKWMAPPPVSIVLALMAVAFFGGYTMSKEVTRIRATQFARLVRGFIFGNGPREGHD